MRDSRKISLSAVVGRVGRRGLLVVLALAITAGLGAAVLMTRGSSAAGPASDGSAGARPQTSLAARFAVLRRARSNRCGMPASALETMRRDGHLQGACCFPMNYRAYVTQLRGLRRYDSVEVIPRDPYDIPVSLAKRLIAYQGISLTADQAMTYKRAIPLSETKGPCCCPCWRATAFEGQAKYLITRRDYSAGEISKVWSLEEGCGGPGGKA